MTQLDNTMIPGGRGVGKNGTTFAKGNFTIPDRSAKGHMYSIGRARSQPVVNWPKQVKPMCRF